LPLAGGSITVKMAVKTTIKLSMIRQTSLMLCKIWKLTFTALLDSVRRGIDVREWRNGL